MTAPLLRRFTPATLPPPRRAAVDAGTLAAAARIVDDVRERGEPALIEHARRLGDLGEGQALVRDRADLRRALAGLPRDQRELLERTAGRIADFAAAQRAALAPLDTTVPGGRAGHDILPIERAGCYAPGGRFPLPSSVLMTAVTARVAGVGTVWVASPRPAAITLAAAAVADVDALLAVGGAQAVAAFAFGAGPVPAMDIVVGPGNRWVTAAKQLVAGRVAIDMLAGPSELVIVADGSARPEVIAADLLAQAEHDPDAVPILITTSAALLDAVEGELAAQLAVLPTAPTAAAALVTGGFAVVAGDLAEALAVADRIAPEHLQLVVADSRAAAARVRHAGALFLGSGAAEVLGDYGAGPNHVLPTGGTARFTGGLSVLNFLRVRTWLAFDDPAAQAPVARDAVALARLEGLEAHARAAGKRL